MSRKTRHRHILDKTKEAAVAAISCYNQPNFCYREESFCILMVNAWELLLKAKIVKDNNEDLHSIYVIDKDARRKDGRSFTKPKYTRNKANNFVTISFKSIINLPSKYNLNLDLALQKQLETLYEFRNASIHLAGSGLSNTVLEVFTATLQSFRLLCKEWFNEQATDHLMLIPLAFDVPSNFSSNTSSEEAQKLLAFVANQEKDIKGDSTHNIRLNIEVKFERSKKGIPVNVGNSGTTIVIDSEENFQNKYPWTYKDDLLPKLKEKYQNFTPNQEFNRVMNELKKDARYCGARYLDWNKKQGTKKWFYSPNIINAIKEKLGFTN